MFTFACSFSRRYSFHYLCLW